ncbi:uncharacterized protein LOC144139514 [Haemaphysalis longicornis]
MRFIAVLCHRGVWHKAVVIFLFFACSVNTAKFLPCGGKPGIVTASKSGALGAKFLATCGTALLLKYAIPPKPAIQIFELFCVGAQLCYAYHSNKLPNTTAFQASVRDCMTNEVLVLNAVKPEIYESMAVGVETFVNDTKACLEGDLFPTDIRVVLAAVRYLRQVVFLGPRK